MYIVGYKAVFDNINLLYRMAEDSYTGIPKNRVTAAELLQLLVADDGEFERLQQRGKVPKGIERVIGAYLNEVFNFGGWYLSGDERYTFLNNVEISGDLTIEHIRKRCCSVILHECRMGDFRMNDCGLVSVDKGEPIDFYFSKCTAERFWVDHHSVVGNFWLDYNSSAGNLRIDHNSVVGFFDLNRSSLIGDVWIDHGSATGDFRILNKSRVGNFYIDHDSAAGNFYILHDSHTDDFRICNNSSVDNIDIINSTTGNFDIFQDSDIGNFGISDGSVVGSCWIYNSSTTGNFDIINSRLEKFIAEGLYCSFSIVSSTLPLMKLSNCRIHEFRIELACKLEGYISGGQINLVNLKKTTLNKETLLSFSGTCIYVLRMEEFAMLGSLYFRQISKADKVFDWFDMEGGLISNEKIRSSREAKKRFYVNKINEFKEAATCSSIYISQSSLNKTEFTDCQLADFLFKYKNSKINECFIMGGTVPEKNIEILDTEPNSREWHEQKASIYNQFKKIFEAQGDIYLARQFQAKWAVHQKKVLALKRAEERVRLYKRGRLERLRLYFNETSQDIYTLWLNEKSNDHGESWLRPLCLLLGIAAIFYVLFLWSMGRCFNSNGFDPNLVGYYFEFVNPLHKSNFVNEAVRPPGVSVFIDFAGRLLIAYFIYQFIAAFRKHGKKQ